VGVSYNCEPSLKTIKGMPLIAWSERHLEHQSRSIPADINNYCSIASASPIWIIHVRSPTICFLQENRISNSYAISNKLTWKRVVNSIYQLPSRFAELKEDLSVNANILSPSSFHQIGGSGLIACVQFHHQRGGCSESKPDNRKNKHASSLSSHHTDHGNKTVKSRSVWLANCALTTNNSEDTVNYIDERATYN